MDFYTNFITITGFSIIFIETVLGIFANIGIFRFKDDSQKIPRIHIAISYLPAFGFILTLPWLKNMTECKFCEYSQILLLALGILAILYELRNYWAAQILLIIAYSGLAYLMIKNTEKYWTEPVGMAGYCLLDVNLGLDLLKYVDNYSEDLKELPKNTKNYLILGLHVLFQLFSVAMSKEIGNTTWLFLSGIGLFECALLCVLQKSIKPKEKAQPTNKNN